MLIRIVRMTFIEEKIPEFMAVFTASKAQIRAFEGCQHLELLQDANQTNILMTYSHWENAQALENYRQSTLFKNTWAKTKILFAEKPIAFSSIRLEQIEM